MLVIHKNHDLKVSRLIVALFCLFLSSQEVEEEETMKLVFGGLIDDEYS